MPDEVFAIYIRFLPLLPLFLRYLSRASTDSLLRSLVGEAIITALASPEISAKEETFSSS